MDRWMDSREEGGNFGISEKDALATVRNLACQGEQWEKASARSPLGSRGYSQRKGGNAG